MAPLANPQLEVDVLTSADFRSARVYLVGDIDLAVRPALVEVVNRLHGLPLSLIVIDLAGVTFVCSTFANFVASLHFDHPEARLTLRHPTRMVPFVLAATGIADFVDAMPAAGSEPTLVPAGSAR